MYDIDNLRITTPKQHFKIHSKRKFRMKLKDTLQDYSESEFLELVSIFFKPPADLNGDALNAYLGDLLDHFEHLVDHPDKSGLIYYPSPDVEDSPAGVLSVVKSWLAENNRPGFRAE